MNTGLIADHRSESNDLRLDEVDVAILRQLKANARIANKDLAAAVGLAPSTCAGRVTSLKAAGVIRGFHADIDYEKLGLHIFGMISVRLTPLGRSQAASIIDRLLAAPGTIEVFQVSGERDLLVHIATVHPTGLNTFIEDHLADPTIAHTQTSLVFSRHQV